MSASISPSASESPSVSPSVSPSASESPSASASPSPEYVPDSPIVAYPDDDFNSWISYEDADIYFTRRFNAGAWFNLSVGDQAALLLTAYRSLQEIELDLTDLGSPIIGTREDLLQALTQAQCEQAHYELTRDLDREQVQAVSIGGLLSANFGSNKLFKQERYSERALMLLRSYMTRKTVKRFR